MATTWQCPDCDTITTLFPDNDNPVPSRRFVEDLKARQIELHACALPG